MPYSALTIANEFIRLGKEDEQPPSNLRLQKLVYFAHAYHLARGKGPLIKEQVRAWPFGPAIKELYSEVKVMVGENGKAPITEEIECDPPTIQEDKEYSEAGKIFASRLVEGIYKTCLPYPTAELTKRTHKQGSPWKQVYRHGERDIEIPDELTKAHYVNRLDELILPSKLPPEQGFIRRKKREHLIDEGINPYPSVCLTNLTLICDVVEGFDKHPEVFKDTKIAGRLMSYRIMGAASFAELQDSSGQIQLYVRRDDICPGEDKSLYNDLFKKKIDIGDILDVEGFAFRTQKGELSIHVKKLRLLNKAIHPLPIVKETIDEAGQKHLHDPFTDPEERYRQRYVDLIVNPQVKDIFLKRARLIDAMRRFLNAKGYLEVETPALQPISGGATARPFVTHHHALDTDLYLRIADELYLKRLIVGGFDAVYEFCKDFRNEGMSRFHNPEFTQMELYVAYKDYLWMQEIVEEMIEQAAIAVHGTTQLSIGGRKVDFARPWPRTTFYGAIQEKTGLDLRDKPEDALRKHAQDLNITLEKADKEAKILDKIFEQCCEPTFIRPTFVQDYPLVLSPLAKEHPTQKGIVERFEVFCCGKEICNAYSELNDPVEQRKRFEAQLKLARGGDAEAMAMDEDFLRALEYGMPPTAGLGVGIDRLTMLVVDAASIQEVIFFPQMRPERPVSSAPPASEDQA